MTIRHKESRRDMPPPPPENAVFTGDVEDRIREDERARVHDELRAFDHDDVHDRDRDAATLAHDDVVEREVVRERTFSVGQALTLLVGAALTALGIIALVQTGIDRPLNEPVEDVFGFGHAPWLGIGEVVAGVLLVLAAVRPGGRWLSALVGAGLVVVGVMIVAEMDWTAEHLGTEQSFGWIPIVAGALALLGAMMTPRRHQRVTEYHRTSDVDDRYVDDDRGERFVDDRRS
jgi:hypothetical protein